MPSRSQVLRLLSDGLDYEEAGRRLGVPAGQAFMIATGLPADGGDTLTTSEQHRPGLPQESTQHLANPPHENPATSERVLRWLKERAGRDAQMRRAAEARDPAPGGERIPEGMTELTTVLTRDHNRVSSLVKQLQALPGVRKGGSPAQLARRGSIADLIAEAMASHTPAEQRHLWPLVRDTLDDGGRIADQALDAAAESTRTLDEMRKTAPDSEEFDDLVERYVLQSRRHVALADTVFVRLRKALTDEERERVGAEVARSLGHGPAERPPGQDPP